MKLTLTALLLLTTFGLRADTIRRIEPPEQWFEWRTPRTVENYPDNAEQRGPTLGEDRDDRDGNCDPHGPWVPPPVPPPPPPANTPEPGTVWFMVSGGVLMLVAGRMRR